LVSDASENDEADPEGPLKTWLFRPDFSWARDQAQEAVATDSWVAESRLPGGAERLVRGHQEQATWCLSQQFIWLGSAIASGILGNASYDALKAALRRRKMSVQGVNVVDISYATALAMAFTALQAEYERRGLIVPALREVTPEGRPNGADGWSIPLRTNDAVAIVEISQTDRISITVKLV
jgi:hypothetical protein